MQRGNFRKPNKNYQRNPPGGNVPHPGGKRKSDPWAKGSKVEKRPAGESSETTAKPGTTPGQKPQDNAGENAG